MSGRQFQLLLPGRRTVGASPSFAGQSRIVAFPATEPGAALIALAIFSSRVIVPVAVIGIWWTAAFWLGI
jgi:hypothetical protein